MFPPKLLLPVVWKLPVAAWLLQGLYHPHHAGQTGLDLEVPVWPSVWVSFQLWFVERGLEPV